MNFNVLTFQMLLTDIIYDLICAGVLLPELVTCLVLLQTKCPLIIQKCGAVTVLSSLLDTLDAFNRLAPALDKEESDDLAWPGLSGTSSK